MLLYYLIYLFRQNFMWILFCYTARDRLPISYNFVGTIELDKGINWPISLRNLQIYRMRYAIIHTGCITRGELVFSSINIKKNIQINVVPSCLGFKIIFNFMNIQGASKKCSSTYFLDRDKTL